VAKECHIIARRDSLTVARSPSLLSDAEREQYRERIEHRHSFANLVLMCGVHSDVIDDPAQRYSVADVLAVKREHEETVARERQEVRARRAAEADEEAPSSAQVPRMLVLDAIPDWPQKAVRQLASSEPESLEWLAGEIGDLASPDDDRLVDLVARWPHRLGDGSLALLYTVARFAEGAGRWREAADVWERVARRAEGLSAADPLVRAAIDAGVGGDQERREALLVEAEKIDPDSPRLRLERLDEDQPATELLEALGGIYSDDPPLAALIAVYRARAAMLLPDIEEAERHLAEARAIEANSVQVRTMSVNLRVQRARIAVRDDTPSSLEDTRAAMREALELRDEMIAMRRWEESGRLLMLAADVPAMMRDPQRARQILEQTRPEELSVPTGAEVLGDAALRANADDLALKFTEDADRSDAIRRIRATAEFNYARTRSNALEELRRIALGGGPEAASAALARLIACLPPVRAGWDDDVAQVLSQRHARSESGLRIMTAVTSEELDQAQVLAAALPNEAWAAELRLEVARAGDDKDEIERAASAFLDFRPDAKGRLMAGTALARADQLARAGEVLAGVAHDLNAPPRIRSDAFAVLIRTLADRDAWPQATREWKAWQALSSSQLERPDDRISAWQVRVLNRARPN
jgi:hypothetical protein